MTFRRDTSAGYLVNHAARLLARQLDARLAPLGLSTGPFPLLLHLWEQDGLTQKDLVDRLGYEQPTVAATLARMERDGLVTRKPDPQDGRAQRVWLTGRGQSLRAAALAEAQAVNAGALAGLTPDEATQFLSLTARVVQALQEAGGAAGRSRPKRGMRG